MKLVLANEPIELRHGLILEILPGEALQLPSAVDSAELRSGPAGSTPTVTCDSITVHAIGRHTFWLTIDGKRMDLTLVGCASELVPFLASQQRSLGHGGGERSTARVRRVMRSMSQNPGFTGRISDCSGAHPELAPALHGC